MRDTSNYNMESTVLSLLDSGKGILAADESFPTIEKRFRAVNISYTDKNRQAYREMLVTTPELNKFISGIILFDDTLRQQMQSGILIPEFLTKSGILPGIKVDKGTTSLANFSQEKITEGLDDLRNRLIEYRELGARFTKWRAVITIGNSIPTNQCIEANARTLALFAALSQEVGLVPIVEPEVLMTGNHSIERCEEIVGLTLKTVFVALFEQKITLELMLLKTSMVLSGTDYQNKASDEEISIATIRCLRPYVPSAVPGIVFLSGGQNDREVTERLNIICKSTDLPWKLSFSFGRALQTEALETWKGVEGNISHSQAALLSQAKSNSLAVHGKY